MGHAHFRGRLSDERLREIVRSLKADELSHLLGGDEPSFARRYSTMRRT